MRVAELVSRTETGLRCEVCQWRCILQPDEYGRCGVRKREGDAIIALSDGMISAATIGPIEDYGFRHFFPEAMVFAVGGWGSPFPAHHDHIHHARLPDDPAKQRALDPERVVKFAQERLARGIIWSYNDPVITHENLLDTMRLARAGSRITGIVTGGFWSKAALDQLGPYLDGINLTLHGFSASSYAKLTGIAEWRGILAGVERAVKHWNCHLEITTPIATGINDSSTEIQALGNWIKLTFGPHIPWRIIPAQDADTNSALGAREIAQSLGLHFIYGPESTETTRCPGCGWAIIERHSGQTKLVGISDGRCDNCDAEVYLRTSLFKQRNRTTPKT